MQWTMLTSDEALPLSTSTVRVNVALDESRGQIPISARFAFLPSTNWNPPNVALNDRSLILNPLPAPFLVHLDVACLKARLVIQEHVPAILVARKLGREHEALVHRRERAFKVARGEMERKAEGGGRERLRVRRRERARGRRDEERQVCCVGLCEAVQGVFNQRKARDKKYKGTDRVLSVETPALSQMAWTSSISASEGAGFEG